MGSRVLDEGRPAAAVAADLGVSPKTVDKWIRRYCAAGKAGLQDGSKKRTEGGQAAALAVNALTGRRLEAIGAHADVARVAPGVAIVDARPSHRRIVIRGISTDIALESNTTTSLYFDDVPVTETG